MVWQLKILRQASLYSKNLMHRVSQVEESGIPLKQEDILRGIHHHLLLLWIAHCVSPQFLCHIPVKHLIINPLLKSLSVIDKAATEVCALFDKEVHKSDYYPGLGTGIFSC